MKRDMLRRIAEYTKDRRNKKIWYRVVTCLAAVVVFCTTYALILPAITMENDGKQIHTHGDACYTQVTSITHKEPICTLESLNIHEHTDDCYDEDGELICGYADFVVHEHDKRCYDEDGELWCPLPEIKAHTHKKSCYAEREKEKPASSEAGNGHVHTEDCYEIVEAEPEEVATGSDADQVESREPEKVLICDLEETEISDSTDLEEDEDEERELICDQEEIILHKHTKKCFDEDGHVICGKLQVLEHEHTKACFETYEEPVDTETLTCGLEEDENHTHGPRCYGIWKLTCGLEGYTPSNTVAQVQTPPNALKQGSMLMMLPAGAQVPPGYDVEFSYIDPDNRFGVVVYAPEGALPENAVLIAELLDEESEEYAKAEEALESLYGSDSDEEGDDEDSRSTYDGFVALDIRFEADGEEVEPAEPVYVCINIVGLLPEEADPDSVEVQHHAQATKSSLLGLIKKNEITAEKVADTAGENGVVEVVEDENEDLDECRRNIMAAFEIDGFSTFTATYSLFAAPRAASEPIADNVFTVDAVNVLDPNANVILVYPDHFNKTGKEISVGNIISLGYCFGNGADFSKWYDVRIENRGGRYQVLQQGAAHFTTGVQVPDAYLLLIKKDYVTKHGMKLPKYEWADQGNTAWTGNGDTAQFNLLANKDEKLPSGNGPYAYVTFSPVNSNGLNGEKGAKSDDEVAVQEDAIRFQLFDYSGGINYIDGGETRRAITPYFSFRGAPTPSTTDTYRNINLNDDYDQDGFTLRHATVERTLTTDGYPVLDLIRQADGGEKKPLDPMPSQDERSLAYLFGGKTDGAVTVYNPKNTILQKEGTSYYYNSAVNAVDYDPVLNEFHVRGYKERNSSTANYKDGNNNNNYYDFLPFNYTDGIVVGTSGEDGVTYNLDTTQVDYWFGMRMDVNFYQYKDGQYEDDNMVFHFSGDDDVWVFIDDVLVLDLGGTHGSVSGSIDFATGEIEQYLDWAGTDGRVTGELSYPTTLKQCFEAAGKTPAGGWNQDGTTFADYSSHRMSFFYMERGGAVANCSLDFNLPTLPDKALQVTKELAADDEADADVVKYLKDTMTYKFRVVKADKSGNPTDELLVKAGETYVLYGDGITDINRTGTVGADGYFTLKAGQTAEFTDMMQRFEDNEPRQYFVQEVLPTDLRGQYGDIVYTVGADNGTCKQEVSFDGTNFIGFNSPLLYADTGNLVAYRNTVDTEQLSELQITKRQIGSAITGEPEFYLVKVLMGLDAEHRVPIAVGTPYFVGEETRTVETAGIIKIKADETAKLKLLAGTAYYVEEVDEEEKSLTGNELYKAAYSGNREGTIQTVASKVAITITNTYPTGDLEVSKKVVATDGGDTSGEFSFEMKFEVPEGWNGSSYNVTFANVTNNSQVHSGDKLTFTHQESTSDGVTKYYAVASLNLFDGETAWIKDIPSGVTVTIKETNSDGYSVKWKIGETETYTDTVTVTIPDKTQETDAASIVTAECTNTIGYALPNTGGAGTRPYTTGGLLFTAAAGVLLMYNNKKRRKEETASF